MFMLLLTPANELARVALTPATESVQVAFNSGYWTWPKR